MCTLSWIRGIDGYSVFMNRDEQPTRAPGVPPGVQGAVVRWIAPLDGQSHGTWIGANDRGVTLAILNRYHESPMSADGAWISRGLLVTSLLEETDQDSVERRLRDELLGRYQPFTLVAFEVGRGARLFAWNGKELVLSDVVETGLVITRLRLRPGEGDPGPGSLVRAVAGLRPDPSDPSDPSAPGSLRTDPCQPQPRKGAFVHMHAPARSRHGQLHADRCAPSRH